jgi:hypothetical protein
MQGPITTPHHNSTADIAVRQRRPAALLVRLLFALAGTGVMIAFVIGVAPDVADDAGFRRVTFAFLVSFVVLVWVVVLQRLLHLSLGAAYYRPRAWERNGRVYERLGVRVAKYLLTSRVWRNPAFLFRSRGDRMLAALDDTLREAETGHVLAFGAMLFFTVYALAHTWWEIAGWLTCFNVLVNGYPILLQRYNRGRLEELRRRRSQARGPTRT